MNFTVNLNELQEAVNKTLPAIPPKSTLPVLEHLKFELSNNKLEIVSTDQEITIKTEVQVEDATDGKILVPGRKLNDILKALGKTEKILFKTDESNYEIDIETSFGTYKMKGLSNNEYIELPELFETNSDVENKPAEEVATIPQADVIRLADKTAFAVSNDDFRPAMTGVLFQFRNTYLNAVSTDSYRLVKATYNTEPGQLPDELDIIMPSRTMDLLKKADSDVEFSFIKNNEKVTHIRFKIGKTIYISRIIDERFPPYESVIPTNNSITLTVNKSQLQSAIKRVAIFANDITKQLKVNISGSEMKLTAQDVDSGTKADENISCTLEGNDVEIGFNYKFLDEAIGHLNSNDDDEVVFTLSESNKPALIMPEKDSKDLLMLIMPVRLNN
ncbi:MAG: DNA polymerase III subunit beta [Chlorobiota bacterium]